MKLTNLSANGFRNLSSGELSFSDGVNVICGENAQGKTNLIEAIWMFTGNASFRGSKPSQMIAFDKKTASVSIQFEDSTRIQDAFISIGEKKEMRLNGVPLSSSSEFCGHFYAVVFSPAHLSLVQEGPVYRRRFLDIAISQIRPQYGAYLSRYEKLIDQRNALLKQPYGDDILRTYLSVWDEQISKIGTILTSYRNDYITKLSRIAAQVYDGLSGQKEPFAVSYDSTVFSHPADVTSYEERHIEAYQKALEESFVTDRKQGFTSVGPHRDDLSFTLSDRSARLYGSQGQQRSCVIALKLAEAKLLKKAVGESPVLLLDDVMSELDPSRQHYILHHVRDLQVFITCCDEASVEERFGGTVFFMKDGALTQKTEE